MDMLIRGKWLARLTFIAILLLLISVITAINYESTAIVQADNTQQCNATSSTTITQPGSGQVVNGVIPVELYSSHPSPVQTVTFFIDSSVLGKGSAVSGLPQLWRQNWHTFTSEDGEHDISAKIRYSDGYICVTEPIEIIINNGGAPIDAELRLNIIPDDMWTGPVNVNFPFEARAILIDAATESFIDDVTEDAKFEWSTSIGTVNYGGYIGNFFSGTSPGSGDIVVDAQYGGLDHDRNIYIDIFNPDDPETTDPDYDDYYGNEDGSSSGDEPNESDNQGANSNDESDGSDISEDFPIPESADNPNRVDYRLVQCLQERLLSDEFNTIVDQQKRLTTKQLESVFGCFSTRRFVIPAAIAPVAPDDVTGLEEESDTARITARDAVKKATPEGGDAILFSGTAKPDSQILIYIFSEPLVLAGQTDSDGNWTYTLEDPLEPGKHEAYVVVDTGDGYVRSPSFGFEIAQAVSTDENPFGYSLALAENDTSELTNYYLWGGSALILIASFVLSRFVWFRPKKQAAIESPEVNPDFVQGAQKISNEADAPETESLETPEPSVLPPIVDDKDEVSR